MSVCCALDVGQTDRRTDGRTDRVALLNAPMGEDIGHVVVPAKSEHKTSCSIEYGLKATLEISRKSDKHKVAIVEPGMDERYSH